MADKIEVDGNPARKIEVEGTPLRQIVLEDSNFRTLQKRIQAEENAARRILGPIYKDNK